LIGVYKREVFDRCFEAVKSVAPHMTPLELARRGFPRPDGGHHVYYRYNPRLVRLLPRKLADKDMVLLATHQDMCRIPQDGVPNWFTLRMRIPRKHCDGLLSVIFHLLLDYMTSLATKEFDNAAQRSDAPFLETENVANRSVGDLDSNAECPGADSNPTAPLLNGAPSDVPENVCHPHERVSDDGRTPPTLIDSSNPLRPCQIESLLDKTLHDRLDCWFGRRPATARSDSCLSAMDASAASEMSHLSGNAFVNTLCPVLSIDVNPETKHPCLLFYNDNNNTE